MNVLEGNDYELFDESGASVGKKLDLRHRKFRSEEPMFVKAYLTDLSQILSVNRGDIAVLIELMKYMTYENIIDITPRIKDKVIEGMGYGTQQTVGNSISKLKKASIILSLNRGSYLIDPKLFSKGSWADILKIKMQITYNKDGTKSIKTKFEKEEISDEVPISPNTSFYPGNNE
jgi:hypothetical protein